VPLFTSAPGIGKSSIVQAWCKENNIPFLDLRLAYLDAPDLIGYPTIIDRDGKRRMTYATPDMFPSEGPFVVFLDEPNRGATSIMNATMQMLTDGKIHQYTFPENTIFVGAINPENEHHDVNHMDAALRNRFTIFEIDYDKKDFLAYMKENNWDTSIIQFIESGGWTYCKPENLGQAPGVIYISPRTWEKVNSALKAQPNMENKLQREIFNAALGTGVGGQFFEFRNNEAPVTYLDLVNNKKLALQKLVKYSDPANTKNGHLSITCTDLVDNAATLDFDLLKEVCTVLPADLTPSLISRLERETNDSNLLDRLLEDAKLKKLLKDSLGKK
jgi:hypothetical protein